MQDYPKPDDLTPGAFTSSEFAAEGASGMATLLDQSANRFFDDFFDIYFG